MIWIGALWLAVIADGSHVRLRGGANDLSYPTPPNPFATDGKPPLPDPRPPEPRPPQPPMGGQPFGAPPAGTDGFAAPDRQEFVGSAPDGLLGASSAEGLLGGVSSGEAVAPPAGLPDPSGTDSAPFAAAAQTAPIRAPRKRGLFRLRPTLCLAALSAACVLTRPGESSLVVALDQHQQAWPELVDAALRDELPVLRPFGLGNLATHGDLVWLGMLGRWLPLLPMSAETVGVWQASIGSAQVLLLSLVAGYLLQKAAPSLMSTSAAALGRGRLHTLLSAPMAPVGLTHLLHVLLIVLVACDEALETALGGRAQLLGWWLASGAASGVMVALSQLLTRRRIQPRSTASGAAMGLLLLRAAALPGQAVEVGTLSLPPLRCLLIHLVRPPTSSAAHPSPRPLPGRTQARLAPALGIGPGTRAFTCPLPPAHCHLP